MSAYRPPEKSLSQKLSENLFVQLSLVVLVGLIAVFLITRNQQQSFWTRVQFLRGSSSTQVSQSKDMSQFSSTYQAEVEPEVVEASQSVESNMPINEIKGKALHSSQAQIYYLEIPRNVLSKWLEEGLLTRVETSEGVTIGYIPQLSQVLEQYSSQIKVLKQESYPYSLNQLYTAKLEKPADPSSNPNMDPSSNPNMIPQKSRSLAAVEPALNTPAPGIVTYATLDDDRNDTLLGQLEVSVNPQTSFPAQFEMTPDQSFFISGFERSRGSDKVPLSETVVVLKIDK